ncbi:MAG: type restriction enzyme subunit [Acidobacteriota bacterium]|nr:type restriction enzyme subunit [Acidobacteriota bacterium]
MTANRVPTIISDLCEITSSKRIYAADYQSAGIPFYRGKEISEKQSGKSGVSTELFISVEKYEEIKKRFGVPRGGDLLLTSVGTLGVPYVVRPNETFYFKDGNLTWFRNLKGIDSRFLYYWLLSPTGKAELKKCTIGSSQPAFTIVLLKGMTVDLPSEPLQRRIAAILSTYDDLIDNNTRRIKILEEMARRIYEEWFVQFRFPGHKNVKMVESELGLIPDSWEVKKLGSLIKRLRAGNTYRENDVTSEGDVMVVDQSTTEYLGFHNNQPDHQASPEKPIIIFGDHTCKLQVMVTPFSIGANTVPFIANDETSIYYLHNLIKGLVTTQEYKRHWTELNNKTVIKAPSKFCNQYDEIVKPFFATMDVLRSKKRNLRRTRDLLLPKLISGEIDVSNFPEPVSD